MTDQPSAAETKTASQANGMGQLIVDLGPVAVFVVSFNVLNRIESMKENAIYIAIGLFIAATLAAIGWCKLRRGKVPPVLLVTGVLVVAFGGLTILLHDPSIIQIKFTVTFLFYAAAILFSLAIKQNVWKLLFRHVFDLPDRIWNILAVRWALFYIAIALLNEVLRYYYNEANGNFDVWLNVRTMLAYPAFFIFALLQGPLVLKHDRTGDKEAPASSAPSA
jgi:intracellular septation protein